MHSYQLEAEEEMDAHFYAFVHDFHNVCIPLTLRDPYTADQ